MSRRATAAAPTLIPAFAALEMATCSVVMFEPAGVVVLGLASNVSVLIIREGLARAVETALGDEKMGSVVGCTLS